MLPEVITFDPTVGISISLVFQKLDIQKFLGTLRSTQSEFGKTFKYVIKFGWEKDEIADVSILNPMHVKGVPSLRKHAKSLCMCMPTCFYTLYPCLLAQIYVLPCLVLFVGLCLLFFGATYLCLFAFVPLMACLDATICENTFL